MSCMRRVIKIVLLLVVSTSYFIPRTYSQDLHFSQFFNSPLVTNPANTGFIPEGDYRLGVNYRNQWASITAFPYKTMSAFGDVQVMPNQENTGWLGLGGLILRDVAGARGPCFSLIFGCGAFTHNIHS